jgi:hypothetical protein
MIPKYPILMKIGWSQITCPVPIVGRFTSIDGQFSQNRWEIQPKSLGNSAKIVEEFSENQGQFREIVG